MLVVVLKNPEPLNKTRRGTNIELRVMIEGATLEEGELIGEAIRNIAQTIRPGIEPVAFQLSEEKVIS